MVPSDCCLVQSDKVTKASAKKQGLLPGASAPAPAPAATTFPKGKRSVLLKCVVTSFKGAMKSKKTNWHCGDVLSFSGSTMCDVADVPLLFPGVALSQGGGVLTTFKMDAEQLSTHFAGLLKGVKVTTWSQPRSFRKAHRTGSQELSFLSAEGKFSKSTSTLSLKLMVECGGGDEYGCGFW